MKVVFKYRTINKFLVYYMLVYYAHYMFICLYWALYPQIVHYTSFQEMSKREGKNVLGSDTEMLMNPEVLNKDGGFYRKGIVSLSRNFVYLKTTVI